MVGQSGVRKQPSCRDQRSAIIFCTQKLRDDSGAHRQAVRAGSSSDGVAPRESGSHDVDALQERSHVTREFTGGVQIFRKVALHLVGVGFVSVPTRVSPTEHFEFTCFKIVGPVCYAHPSRSVRGLQSYRQQ